MYSPEFEVNGSSKPETGRCKPEAGSNLKAQVRSRVRSLRRQLAGTEKDRMDEQILRHLFLLKELAEADVIYSYMSFGGEVDMVRLTEALWRLGRQVAVPRVEGDQIRFYLVSRMEELAPGCRGILEPLEGCEPAEDLQAPVITPGMAFSLDGGRIGYGGGYYDRFFEKEPQHMRIAAAYPFQVYEKLQTEALDRRVHRIVTPDRVYVTGAGY